MLACWHAQPELRGLVNLVIASGLAGVLGWERERRDRPAGLRTHIGVGLAATLIATAAELMALRYRSIAENVDPTRALEAVIAGISFLGAGTILVRDDSTRVRGLTTATSLLVTGAIGLCVGLGGRSACVWAWGLTSSPPSPPG